MHVAGEDLPELRPGDPLDTTGGASARVETPRPAPPPAGVPSELPRTLVRAGDTKILPGPHTTLSQAASPAPDRPSRAPSRIRLKLGIAGSALGLGVVALFSIWAETHA